MDDLNINHLILGTLGVIAGIMGTTGILCIWMLRKPKTRGSNSCYIRIQWSRLFWFRPKFFCICVGGVLLALAAALTIRWWIGLLTIFPALALWVWIEVNRLAFGNGTTNPAVVLSIHPFMVAVYANMSNRHGFCPAIKVMRLRNPCGQVAVGDRTLAAATYQRGASHIRGAWIDVRPVLLVEATTNKKAVEQAMELVDAAEWRSLEEGLKQVPKPYKPDIHFVRLVEERKPFHEIRTAIRWVE